MHWDGCPLSPGRGLGRSYLRRWLVRKSWNLLNRARKSSELRDDRTAGQWPTRPIAWGPPGGGRVTPYTSVLHGSIKNLAHFISADSASACYVEIEINITYPPPHSIYKLLIHK